MEVTNTGFGKFSATNGIDIVTAAYEKGKKTAAGYRTHWKLLFNGRDEKVVYGDRAAAEDAARAFLEKPNKDPMTLSKIKEQMDKDGQIHCIIQMDLEHMLKMGNAQVRFEMTRQLLGDLTDLCIEQLSYIVVAAQEKTLTLRLSAKTNFGKGQCG